jgi:hypothetical protein
MRAGKIVLIVMGGLLSLLGIGFVGGGGTLVWAHTTQRDSSGFYNTPTDTLRTDTYALTASADFGTEGSQGDLWVPVHPAGTVRVQAETLSGRAIFIGVGPTNAVNRWLAGVSHEHVSSIAFGPFSTDTQPVYGMHPAAAPTAQRFWAASASGIGRQSLVWPTQAGNWTAVVMNAAATPSVVVDVRVGMKTGLLLPIGIGLGIFGILLIGLAALFLYLGLRREQRANALSVSPARGHELPAGTSEPSTSNAAAYPVRLDGAIDPATSRWRWLFKWILVIPHAVVLAFLWLAATVLTVVAGFSILFTGRYPRSIFDFNVGVIRWTWRVVFYAIGAFATDRYPPFSLDPDPTYPADFAVDYPERLSRGLVLVKWWLLAIPQYMVVAFFIGGWSVGLNGAWRAVGGFGLIGLLALISAVILCVSGRYPDSIFDFVMGLNRWCYRVLAYAALLRDEYPPFRLDAGGIDPGHFPVPPPGPAGPQQAQQLVGSLE